MINRIGFCCIRVEKEGNEITVQNLDRGEIAVIDDYTTPTYNGRFVMKAFNKFVCLDNGDTWDRDCTIKIKRLPIGTMLTIIVGGGQDAYKARNTRA